MCLRDSIPSLLYAGRFTYMPKGVMPATQGNPNRLNEDKIMFGISTSINVESENESTNDYRAGLEFAMLKNKLYLGAEVYYICLLYTSNHFKIYTIQFCMLCQRRTGNRYWRRPTVTYSLYAPGRK